MSVRGIVRNVTRSNGFAIYPNSPGFEECLDGDSSLLCEVFINKAVIGARETRRGSERELWLHNNVPGRTRLEEGGGQDDIVFISTPVCTGKVTVLAA